MVKIINMTQDYATPGQIEAGVIDLQEGTIDFIRKILTFDDLPSKEELSRRAEEMAELAWIATEYHHCKTVMVKGPDFLIMPMVNAIMDHGLEVVFPFYRVDSVEVVGSYGPRQTFVVNHGGFVSA